jgi:uncharacterized protein (TIGR03067 family)
MKLKMLAVLAGALFAAGAGGQEQGQADDTQLQGTWAVVSLEKGGVDAKDNVPKDAKVVFANGNLKIQAEGKEKGATYKVDTAKKPRHIDIAVKEGNGQEQVHQGIYQLDGDNLKICVAHPGEDRPTEFTTKVGSQNQLLVLKRDK